MGESQLPRKREREIYQASTSALDLFIKYMMSYNTETYGIIIIKTMLQRRRLRKQSEAKETGQWVKCLPCKPGDLSSDHKHPRKSQVHVHHHNNGMRSHGSPELTD